MKKITITIIHGENEIKCEKRQYILKTTAVGKRQ